MANTPLEYWEQTETKTNKKNHKLLVHSKTVDYTSIVYETNKISESLICQEYNIRKE